MPTNQSASRLPQIPSSQFAPHGLLRITPLLSQSLLISHPNTQPLLINAPPSLLRYSNQYKIKKLFGIGRVLVTALNWKCLSGMCGWMLTRLDVKRTQGKLEDTIEYYGPKGLYGIIESFGWFLRRDLLRMNIWEWQERDASQWRDVLEDEVMLVRGIAFYGERTVGDAASRVDDESQHLKLGDEEVQNEADYDNLEGSPHNAHNHHGDCQHHHGTPQSLPSQKRRRISQQDLDWPAWRMTRINPANSSHLLSPSHLSRRQCIMQYALHVKDTKGKFLPQEAKKMGLTPGPQFGQLSKGLPVTLEDGTVIHPKQVHSPSQKGAVVLVVYANEEFAEEFLKKQENFKDYQQDGAHPALYVFHMVPSSLWHNDQYQHFVDRFQKDCQHVVCNDETLYNQDIFGGSSYLQEKLSHIDENIFRSTRSTIVGVAPSKKTNSKNKIPAQHGLHVNVHPRDKARVDKSELKPAQKYDISLDDELKSHIAEYKRAVENTAWDRNNPHEVILGDMSDREAEIAFLGTGSAIPSKYRNVTGIFLNFFDAGNMFLDCGEGSYEQLCRVYGRSEVEDLLVKLQMVHISHMHADHHMGLLEVLERRVDALHKRGITDAAPVMIIGPGSLVKFMHGIEKAAPESNFNYEFFSCHNLMPHEGRNRIPRRLQQVLDQFGLQQFYNIKVDHSCLAYGVIMQHKKGWKLVFSGDTRPCADLVAHGKNATVLIHEATHDDELQHEAIARKHSTTNEAITIGEEMGAYRTLLTHFSQRYPKFPKLHENVADHVGIAFDLCKLNFKDLKTFPRALPAMQKLFEEIILLDDDAEELPDTDHL